ncbi:MAG: GNAT family N-acetyltransferase [Faecalibacillus sp.]
MMIRECQIDDIKGLYLLNKNDLGYDYSQEKMKKQIIKILNKETDKIYVAQIDDQIIGYIHVHDYDLIYQDHLKNILGIAVDKRYRHLGIGRSLLQKAEQWAKDTDAKGIRLVSGEERKEAHKFYQACGYQLKKKQCYFVKLF